MFRGVNVVSISVPDLAAARTFYSKVLGLGAPVYDLADAAGWNLAQARKVATCR